MKTALKIVVGLIALIAVLAGAGLGYLVIAFPKVAPASDRKAVATPERIARGEYVARHLSACIDCHSRRDWTRFSGPILAGTDGAGGELFGHEIGLPGEIYASNVTPAALGKWTDGEIARVITTGVTRDGRALFPLMAYPMYGEAMCQDDVDAIVAYLRTLKPIDNPLKAPQLDFPMGFVVRTIPKDRPRPPCPDRNDELAYGRYLTLSAACVDCHTPSEKGAHVPGMDYAGGMEFKIAGLGTVRSSNITPSDSGIGTWEKEYFIETFREYRDIVQTPLTKGAMQTVMPWTLYGGLTDEDLGAIYTFLRTIAPVVHEVDTWTAQK